MPVRQPRALRFESETSWDGLPSRPGPQHGGKVDPQSPRSRFDQHDLIERVVSYRVRRGDDDRHAGLAEHLQARYLGRSYRPGVIVGYKREHHDFQELGVSYGLDVIQVDLPRSPREASDEGPVSAAEPTQATEWEFRTHQLLMVPRARSGALMGHPSVAEAKGSVWCRVRRCQRPSRRRIMLDVARACRYPRTLLDCHPLAMEVLQARGFRVWTTTFGAFLI